MGDLVKGLPPHILSPLILYHPTYRTHSHRHALPIRRIRTIHLFFTTGLRSSTHTAFPLGFMQFTYRWAKIITGYGISSVFDNIAENVLLQPRPCLIPHT